MFSKRRWAADLLGEPRDGLQLLLGVGGEHVDRHDDRDAELVGVLDLLPQVAEAGLDQPEVLLGVLGLQGDAGNNVGTTAVHLQSPALYHLV